MQCFTIRRDRLLNCARARFRRACNKSSIKALAKEPKDRFQNMEDFRNELRQVLQEVDPVPPGIRAFAGTAASSARRKSRFARGSLVEIDHAN